MTTCGHDLSAGYGTTPDGLQECYACCAIRDRAAMIRDGNSQALPLYLTRRKLKPEENPDEYIYHEWIRKDTKWVEVKISMAITNWPGSLRFRPTHVRTWKASAWGGQILAHTVYFIGPDGFEWIGTQKGYGDILRARRTKRYRIDDPSAHERALRLQIERQWPKKKGRAA